jgi:hypothetical protein
MPRPGHDDRDPKRGSNGREPDLSPKKNFEEMESGGSKE